VRYPILTVSACQRLADQKRDGLEPAIDADVSWQGVDDEVDLRKIELVAETMVDAVRQSAESADRDRIEGEYSVPLMVALEVVPFEVLDDPGFWRYLSLAYFWDFISWREEGPFDKGNHLRYVDCVTSTESVLTRMFLRANSVGGRDHADLAGALEKATDFWRSHILRVRTGTAPPVTRAFVEEQKSDRLSTGPLREVARSLNRTWTNIVPQLYTQEEASELISGIREGLDLTDPEGYE